MIDELHFFVDQSRDVSVMHVCVEQSGIKVVLTVETPDPTMGEWSKESIDAFGNEVNTLMTLVMGDFHRLRNGVSRNAQLEANGLKPDFTEMFAFHEAQFEEDNPAPEVVA